MIQNILIGLLYVIALAATIWENSGSYKKNDKTNIKGCGDGSDKKN